MSGVTQATFMNQRSFGPPPPGALGSAYEGGFYTGKIVQGGITYYLIVAPKSSGENSSKQYKTANTAAPTDTKTLNNGPSASTSMNDAAYPAAQFCEGLTIGGFSDWYLPSRDELELCYRNLKPTTDNNQTNARSKSSYIYPEGDDVAGDTRGINRNSDPSGAAYTTGSPARTSVSAFQSGGAEAFTGGDYWSSSEFSSSSAWGKYFVDGGEYEDSKTASYRARAVRRVAV